MNVRSAGESLRSAGYFGWLRMKPGFFQWQSLKTRVILLTLAMFLISIWSLFFYASGMLLEDMTQLLGEQQRSALSLLAPSVNNELAIRLRALEEAGRIAAPLMSDKAGLQLALDRGFVLPLLFNAGVVAINADGICIADLPRSTGRVGIDYRGDYWIDDALKLGKSVIGRPTSGIKLHVPVFVMTVPIRNPLGKVIGVMAGVVSLGKPNFLDEIAGSRYGKDGEFMLVAPEYRLVVIASDKHRIMEQLPLPSGNDAIGHHLDGSEKTSFLVDWHGQNTLVSSRVVPLSGWLVVAAFPAKEASAPIARMQRRMLLAAILLTLLAGGLTWWMLRRQLSPMVAAVKTLAALSETGQPLQPLEVTRKDEVGELIGGFNCLLEQLAQREGDLKRSEARFSTLIEWSPEPLAVHRAGELIYVNPAAVKMFGAGSAQELLGRPILDRVHPDFRQFVRERMQTAAIGHIAAPLTEENFLKLDGTVIDVEVQSISIDYDGAPAVQVAMRDVTARKQAEEALARESRRNEIFLRNASDGVHILNADGKVLEVSDSFCDMLGYSREELIGANVARWDAQWSSQELKQKIAEQIARKERTVFETKHRRADGSVVDVEITGRGLELDGNPVIFNSARDITARNRFQSELRTLSRAIEQSPASIVITDRAGNIEYVNPRFEHVSGYTRTELIGKNPRLRDSGRIPAEIYDQILATISRGGEWRGELCSRHKNGELYWEAAAISGVRGEGGGIEHYIAVNEDITERKRANEALRESESRFSAIFHTSPIAVSVSRVADDRVLDVNGAALHIYGLARDEVIGRTVAELGICAIPSQRDAMLLRLREQGRLERFELDIRNSSGPIRKLEVTGRAIELHGEQHLVAMMEDVTDRKRLQEAHLQAQKLESLGTLTAGIAHDFNNILAAICGNADLAAEDVGRDHLATESLEEIRKAGARASELVRRIMAFGRPKETRQELVDLSGLVEEVLKLLRSTMPAGILLTKKFSKTTPAVLADAGQVHEAVVNLTTNAAYAIGRRAGSIEYRLEPAYLSEERASGIPGLAAGLYACLTVADTGSGIDSAAMERIFDAFYTTKPVGEGTGLGLSMVHGTMKSHGGAVTVTSVPGKGSSFALYFPAARKEGAKKDNVADAKRLPTPGKRVLYVDDEEALALLASRALSRLGHKISGFTDPAEALKTFRARAQDFDIVVTDLSMPHMSGFDLAREVLSIRPNMPILIATGYVAAEDEVSARALGISGLILKPATMEELSRALDRHFLDPEDGD